MTTSLSIADAGRAITDPATFADFDRLHALLALLRAEDPVHLVEADDFPPFWLVTRHADVMDIELQPDRFTNEPEPVLANWEAVRRNQAQGPLLRTLIHMDAPDHPRYRTLVIPWFRPGRLGRLTGSLDALSAQALQTLERKDGECDFARDVAMPFPLQVILAILGLPEADYPRMLQLTQELFGATDPDVSRGTSLADLEAILTDFFAYFTTLTADRRETPTEDLASMIANAELDGHPLGDLETISYYVIIATAGHDTTSSAMAGGMQALIDHPDQLARLRGDMSLLPTAVDEMIRWVSPVKHFMRTARTDYELGGKRIKAGDWLMLSYVSANRDEAEFAAPFTFDVGRTPNHHLAFGFGPHFCLGTQLAKMELESLFGAILPRLDQVYLAGRRQLT
jgi:cytochrome P450